MPTTMSIDGSPVVYSRYNAWPTEMYLRAGGISTLTLARRGGSLVGLPDPWLGKPVELSIDGVRRFAGEVVAAHPEYTEIGWVTQYQSFDLRWLGDTIAFTDSNTLGQVATYNLPGDDPNWSADRAGRSVGQILADALTMDVNAAALDALGIGAYTSLSPPTLPADTLADLATLTTIPPDRVMIGGERMLGCIQTWFAHEAPNHVMWIRPSDGAFRFLDMRATADNTLTMEVDPIRPTPLSRSTHDCYQRVVVQGVAIAEPILLTLTSGGLAEDFAWGGLTSDQAKAAYQPADSAKDEKSRSQGTCTCTDTLNVVLTSTPGTDAWDADSWDQNNGMGQLFLWHSAGSGITQFTSRRVVANAAKTSGGTSSFMLDLALPATNYDNYILYGLSSGPGLVYCNYKVVDPDIAAAMARKFTYGAVWLGSNGDVATVASYPIGSACYSPNGLPPFQEWPIPFTQNPSNGRIVFATPTYKMVGGHEPSDVRCLLAINTGLLRAVAPSSGYAGTSHAIEGLVRTLAIECRDWRDPINQAAMEAFAQEMLDSVKDTIVEGEVTYEGLYEPALEFGNGISVTGSTYDTGWESLNLPIRETRVTWNNGSPWHHTTTMSVSNRRASLTSGDFLHPDRATDGALAGIPGAVGNADEGNRANFGKDFGDGNASRFQKDVTTNGMQGSTLKSDSEMAKQSQQDHAQQQEAQQGQGQGQEQDQDQDPGVALVGQMMKEAGW